MRQYVNSVTNRVGSLKRLAKALPSVVARNGGVLNLLAKLRNVLRDEGLPGLIRALARVEARAASGGASNGRDNVSLTYLEWVRKYDTIDDDTRAKIRGHIARMLNKPLISVVMPVYNPNPKHLDQTIRSVRAQLYQNWELCIADDASTDPNIRKVINEHAKREPRIKAVYRETNGHICQATNSALELARGEFIALLDHDDIIPEHALYWIAAEIEQYPDADILYTDSDLVDDENQRYAPYFKSDFNLELMLGHNMVSHLGAYRRSLVKAVGGMRAGLEGSQDYDLLLRIFAKSALERVRHIPAVLYHWRRSYKAPTYSMKNLDRCVLTAQRAVSDFLIDRGITADVGPAPTAPFWQRIKYCLPGPLPKVSIIIPTKNGADLLERCLCGLLKETDYPLLDVTIVDNRSDDVRTKSLLEEVTARDHRVRVIRYPGLFNYSAINNMAVEQTDGEILAFINNDIEIVQPDWLSEMVHRAMRPEVGAVGAKLNFPNGTIQHAGVVLGLGGPAGHLYYNAPRGYTGPFGEALLAREVTAVTAACMVVRKSVFLENGGFDEKNLPVAYNDVDFCLRLRTRGYKNVITPFAELTHHESATRGSDHTPQHKERVVSEIAYMWKRWGEFLENDPYFNPNFSLSSALPALAMPPRISRPWEAPP